MVMDIRRTCYVEDWYFGQGDDTKAKVRWYVAPAGAKFFEGPTPFRSLDWWDGRSPIERRPGPVVGKRGTYDKGTASPLYSGQEPCGDPAWFAGGVPSPVPPTPVRDADGVPQCCAPIRRATFAIQGFSPVQWQPYTPGVAFRGTYMDNETNAPFYVFWPSVVDGDRCLLTAVAVTSGALGSLSLTVPVGWSIISDRTRGQTRLWVAVLRNAPLNADGATFTVAGASFLGVAGLIGFTGVTGGGIDELLKSVDMPINHFPNMRPWGPPPNPINGMVLFMTWTPGSGVGLSCQGFNCVLSDPSGQCGLAIFYDVRSDGTLIYGDGTITSATVANCTGIVLAAVRQPGSFGQWYIQGQGSAAFHGAGLAASTFAVAGSAALSFAGLGVGVHSGDFAVAASSTFAPVGELEVVSTNWGTAITTVPALSITVPGVTLVAGELLLVTSLSAVIAPTSPSWGTVSIGQFRRQQQTVLGVQYTLHTWWHRITAGQAGTHDVTLPSSAPVYCMAVRSVRGLAGDALDQVVQGNGTGTTVLVGPTVALSAPDGYVHCAVGLRLRDNGVNTSGTWAGGPTQAQKVASNLGALDVWCEVAEDGYQAGETARGEKDGTTSGAWVAMCLCFH